MSVLSNIMSVLETIKLCGYIDHLAVSNQVHTLARRVISNAGGRIIGACITRCATVDNARAGETLYVGDTRYGSAVLADFLIWGEREGATTT